MRPGAVPWAYARVLKASVRISPMDKLIWLEHLGLVDHKKGGAYISASGVADRLGITRVSVERARAKLHDFGVLAKKGQGPGRAAVWRPQLPPDCTPHARTLTDDEAKALAEALDRHIASLTGEGGADTEKSASDHLTHPREEVFPRSAPGSPSAAGRSMSEGYPHSQEGPFHSARSVEDGEDGEDGAELRVTRGEDVSRYLGQDATSDLHGPHDE